MGKPWTAARSADGWPAAPCRSSRPSGRCRLGCARRGIDGAGRCCLPAPAHGQIRRSTTTGHRTLAALPRPVASYARPPRFAPGCSRFRRAAGPLAMRPIRARGRCSRSRRAAPAAAAAHTRHPPQRRRPSRIEEAGSPARAPPQKLYVRSRHAVLRGPRAAHGRQGGTDKLCLSAVFPHMLTGPPLAWGVLAPEPRHSRRGYDGSIVKPSHDVAPVA